MEFVAALQGEHMCKLVAGLREDRDEEESDGVDEYNEEGRDGGEDAEGNVGEQGGVEQGGGEEDDTEEDYEWTEEHAETEAGNAVDSFEICEAECTVYERMINTKEPPF